MSGQVLNTFTKAFSYQMFDAHNPAHIAAYQCLKHYGRQHPTLRFYLEEPYVSVPHMMEARIAEAYLKTVPGVDAELAAAGV